MDKITFAIKEFKSRILVESGMGKGEGLLACNIKTCLLKLNSFVLWLVFLLSTSSAVVALDLSALRRNNNDAPVNDFIDNCIVRGTQCLYFAGEEPELCNKLMASCEGQTFAAYDKDTNDGLLVMDVDNNRFGLDQAKMESGQASEVEPYYVELMNSLMECSGDYLSNSEICTMNYTVESDSVTYKKCIWEKAIFQNFFECELEAHDALETKLKSLP